MKKLPDRGDYAVKPPNEASPRLVYRIYPLAFDHQGQPARQQETWFGRWQKAHMRSSALCQFLFLKLLGVHPPSSPVKILVREPV